jgi:hypothetical protein
MMTCLAGVAGAQDAHHWSQHYGTESTLLSGVVIGSSLDLSAIYYNPGAIVLLEDYEFLLSASVFDVTTLKFKGLSESEPTVSSIRTQPGFVSVALPSDWLPSNQLAACYLKRQRSEGRFIGHSSDLYSAAQSPGGLENSDGEVIVEQRLDEDWYGVGWARNLSPTAGIGVTQFLAVRSHRARLQTTAQELTAGGDVAFLIAADEFDYRNFRLLWKLGMALDNDPLSLGLTVTTPSVNLFGGGSTFFNRTHTGFDFDGGGTVDPVYAVDFQDELDSEYPSSWAVGLGAAYGLGSTRLHFSAEWFDAVEGFTVLDAKAARSQSTGEAVFFSLEQELDSVINWGVGIEHEFANGMSAYGSFATDKSAVTPGSSRNLSMTTWDIYQVVGGTSFTFAKTDFNLGLGYSFGSDTRAWPHGSIELDDDAVAVDIPESVDADFKRIKVIFGFSFSI